MLPLKLAQPIPEEIWKLLGVSNVGLTINIIMIMNIYYMPDTAVSTLHF